MRRREDIMLLMFLLPFSESAAYMAASIVSFFCERPVEA